MAPNIAVCVLLVLSTFSPVNGGLNMSRTRMEEESSKPCSREKCDRLKSKLEEQEESYQVACGANTGRPKVDPMVLGLLRSPPEGFGLGVTWW